MASGCLARGHTEIQLSGLPAGDYILIADSWVNSSGSVFAGDYRVAVEWRNTDIWNEIPYDDGVDWRWIHHSNAYGGVQTINQLIVSDYSLNDLQPLYHGGCSTVANAAPTIGAFAGINGGFFGSGCSPLNMVKADGALEATNTLHQSQGGVYPQRTMGWNPSASPIFDWIDQGVDWSAVSNAMGGYPSLVDSGVAFAEIYPGQQVWSSTDWSQHPRTAVGVDYNGFTHLVTVDGRTSAGSGMTTTSLAELMSDLGAEHAINFDGGSTTMYLQDCSLNDIINFPSDNSSADHYGARSVSDGL